MTDQTSFLEAMAALPGAVSIIATGQGDRRAGLVASAVCSLSADPPSLLVCVNQQASAHDALLTEGRFTVNVVDCSHLDVARHFASAKGIEKFALGEWTEHVTGAPALKDAAVVFDCEIARVADGFSHSIVIGYVRDVVIRKDDGTKAMAWHGRRFRTLMDLDQPS